MRWPWKWASGGKVPQPKTGSDTPRILLSYGAHFCVDCGEWLTGSAESPSGWAALRDHIKTEHGKEDSV